jgi:hypothetical protein
MATRKKHNKSRKGGTGDSPNSSSPVIRDLRYRSRSKKMVSPIIRDLTKRPHSQKSTLSPVIRDLRKTKKRIENNSPKFGENMKLVLNQSKPSIVENLQKPVSTTPIIHYTENQMQKINYYNNLIDEFLSEMPVASKKTPYGINPVTKEVKIQKHNSFDNIMFLVCYYLYRVSPIFTDEESKWHELNTGDTDNQPTLMKNKCAEIASLYCKIYFDKPLENNTHTIFFNEYKKLIAKYIDERPNLITREDFYYGLKYYILDIFFNTNNDFINYHYIIPSDATPNMLKHYLIPNVGLSEYDLDFDELDKYVYHDAYDR